MATRKRVILRLDSKLKVIREHEKGTNRAHLRVAMCEQLCEKLVFLFLLIQSAIII